MDELDRLELAGKLDELSGALKNCCASPHEMVGAFDLSAILKVVVAILTQILPLLTSGSGPKPA